MDTIEDTCLDIKGNVNTGRNKLFFADAKIPGLGLRVTSTGVKSYIFESRLHGKTLRITIGSVQTWPLSKAQTEAARLKVLIDQGIDPRQLEKEKKAIDEVTWPGQLAPALPFDY